MSTIKSSDEHLTLNADGSGNDIKFQSNGSEVASISDGGVVTATSFAGSGANLTGISAGPFTEVSTHKFTYTTTLNPMIQIIDSTNTVKAQMQGGNVSAVFGSASDHPVDFIQGAGEATRMRINTSGVLSVPNGIELGSGIDATAANTLDDYEEGSWSPAYQGSGGSAGSLAHTTQEGYYTKVGRLVTCQYNLTLSNRGSWSGEVRLTGLPFTPADTFPAAGSVGVHKINYSGGSVGSINVYVNPGVSYFRFMYSQDNDNRTFIQVQDCHDDCQLNGIISYIV